MQYSYKKVVLVQTERELAFKDMRKRIGTWAKVTPSVLTSTNVRQISGSFRMR